MTSTSKIPFQVIDWSNIVKTEHKGESGMAYWQTLQYPGLRIRLVEYSPNYKAHHWCRKGHIFHCIEGSVVSTLKSGESFELKAGMCYVVSDELSEHLSYTIEGAKLLIVDGDFLGLKD